MSTLKVNDIEEATSGGGKIWQIRAWAAISTKANTIHDDGNVSSVGDNGNAKHQINFSNALSHANYAVSGALAKNDSNDDGNMTGHFNGYNDGNSSANTTGKTHIRGVFNTSNTNAESGRVTCMVVL